MVDFLLSVSLLLHSVISQVKTVRFQSSSEGCSLLAIIEHFFASSYGLDVIIRYWSKSAFFKAGGGHFKRKFQALGDVHQLALLVSEK